MADNNKKRIASTCRTVGLSPQSKVADKKRTAANEEKVDFRLIAPLIRDLLEVYRTGFSFVNEPCMNDLYSNAFIIMGIFFPCTITDSSVND